VSDDLRGFELGVRGTREIRRSGIDFIVGEIWRNLRGFVICVRAVVGERRRLIRPRWSIVWRR
jgi:hypothetical protein